jgi:hypothetical protein
MEFPLPVLRYREARWRHRTGSAHDEALSIPGNIELKVAGRTILRRALDPKERLRLAKLQTSFGANRVEPIIGADVKQLSAIRTPPHDPAPISRYLPPVANKLRRSH